MSVSGVVAAVAAVAGAVASIVKAITAPSGTASDAAAAAFSGVAAAGAVAGTMLEGTQGDTSLENTASVLDTPDNSLIQQQAEAQAQDITPQTEDLAGYSNIANDMGQNIDQAQQAQDMLNSSSMNPSQSVLQNDITQNTQNDSLQSSAIDQTKQEPGVMDQLKSGVSSASDFLFGKSSEGDKQQVPGQLDSSATVQNRTAQQDNNGGNERGLLGNVNDWMTQNKAVVGAIGSGLSQYSNQKFMEDMLKSKQESERKAEERARRGRGGIVPMRPQFGFDSKSGRFVRLNEGQ